MIKINPVIIEQGVFSTDSIIDPDAAPSQVTVPDGFTWSIIDQNEHGTFIKIEPASSSNPPTGIYRIIILSEYIDFYFIRISEYYNQIKNDAKNWLADNWDTLMHSDGDYPGDPADPPERPADDASPEEWEAYNQAMEEYSKNELEPKAEEFKKAVRKTLAKAIARILSMSWYKF